jgi:hypothetical protein
MYKAKRSELEQIALTLGMTQLDIDRLNVQQLRDAIKQRQHQTKPGTTTTPDAICASLTYAAVIQMAIQHRIPLTVDDAERTRKTKMQLCEELARKANANATETKELWHLLPVFRFNGTDLYAEEQDQKQIDAASLNWRLPQHNQQCNQIRDLVDQTAHHLLKTAPPSYDQDLMKKVLQRMVTAALFLGKQTFNLITQNYDSFSKYLLQNIAFSTATKLTGILDGALCGGQFALTPISITTQEMQAIIASSLEPNTQQQTIDRLRTEMNTVFNQISTATDEQKEMLVKMLGTLREQLSDAHKDTEEDDEKYKRPYCTVSFSVATEKLDVEDPEVVTIIFSSNNSHRRHCYLVSDLKKWFASSPSIYEWSRAAASRYDPGYPVLGRLYRLPLSGTWIRASVVDVLFQREGENRTWIARKYPTKIYMGGLQHTQSALWNIYDEVYDLLPVHADASSVPFGVADASGRWAVDIHSDEDRRPDDYALFGNHGGEGEDERIGLGHVQVASVRVVLHPEILQLMHDWGCLRRYSSGLFVENKSFARLSVDNGGLFIFRVLFFFGFMLMPIQVRPVYFADGQFANQTGTNQSIVSFLTRYFGKMTTYIPTVLLAVSFAINGGDVWDSDGWRQMRHSLEQVFGKGYQELDQDFFKHIHFKSIILRSSWNDMMRNYQEFEEQVDFLRTRQHSPCAISNWFTFNTDRTPFYFYGPPSIDVNVLSRLAQTYISAVVAHAELKSLDQSPVYASLQSSAIIKSAEEYQKMCLILGYYVEIFRDDDDDASILNQLWDIASSLKNDPSEDNVVRQRDNMLSAVNAAHLEVGRFIMLYYIALAATIETLVPDRETDLKHLNAVLLDFEPLFRNAIRSDNTFIVYVEDLPTLLTVPSFSEMERLVEEPDTLVDDFAVRRESARIRRRDESIWMMMMMRLNLDYYTI